MLTPKSREPFSRCLKMAGTRARYVRPRATEPCEIQIVVQIPDVREHAHAKCQMMVHGHGGVTCIQTTEGNGTGVTSGTPRVYESLQCFARAEPAWVCGDAVGVRGRRVCERAGAATTSGMCVSCAMAS